MTTTTIEKPSQTTAGVLRLRPTPSYVQELRERGFTVVKGIITQEKSAEYRSRGYDWLEKLSNGFKRDDKDTWSVANLPPHAKGGMYQLAGVGHEQFVWDLRCEQPLIDVFASIWDTDELLTSFDGMNFALPLPENQYDHKGKPWPHVDQSPLRTHMHCVQGIVSLSDSGPDDGGLMVLEGSMPLYSEFFETHQSAMPEGGWSERDLYLHTEEQLQWFYDRGCKWQKICCGPGDLMIWDSRCVHFGAVPSGERARVAAYVCYKPAAMITPEALQLRQEAFASSRLTTHDPIIVKVQPFRPEYEGFPTAPTSLPNLSDKGKKLAGVMPY